MPFVVLRGPGRSVTTLCTHTVPFVVLRRPQRSITQFGTRGGCRVQGVCPVRYEPTLDRDDGHTLYRRRQAIIEPTLGQTKFNRGADRFRRRGLAAVQAEWRLITATHNLLKLWRAANAPAAA